MSAPIVFQKRTILLAFMVVVLAVGVSVPSVMAYADPTAAEKQAEADEALQKYNALQSKLDALQEKLDTASDNYYAALDAQKKAEEKVDKAKKKVEEKTKEVEAYQGQLADRARNMYRSGDTSFLDVILGASSFEEFATTWNTLEKLTEHDAELVQQTKDARAELEAAQAEAEKQAQVAADKAAEAKQVKDEAEGAAAEAEDAAAEAQDLYKKLSDEAKDLKKKEEEAAARAAAAAAAASHKHAQGGSVNNSKVQSITGNIVVDRAYAQLGKPYRWGAAGPSSFDCSGLVGYCLTGSFGNHWCSTSSMRGWTVVTNPKPGDLCLNSHHTGVYIGGGQMIHAPQTGDVVKVSPVHSDMWYVRY